MIGLGLLVEREGTEVDVEELVGEAAEEEGVALELEVRLEVLCCADDVVVVARVQEVGGLLQVLRFLEVDNVFYPVYQFGQELDCCAEGLDVLVVVRNLQREDQACLLVPNLLLDYPVQVGVEVAGHLVSDYVCQFVPLCLLLGNFELVEQLIGHLDDPPLLDEDVVGVFYLGEVLLIVLLPLELP